MNTGLQTLEINIGKIKLELDNRQCQFVNMTGFENSSLILLVLEFLCFYHSR